MREEMISQCLEIVMGDKIEKSMKGNSKYHWREMKIKEIIKEK